MSFLSVLSTIMRHPLSEGRRLRVLSRFLRWQFASRILGQPALLPFVEDTVLVTEKGMTGATGNWYCALHEVHEMGFLLHFLRPEELFLDVGANVGSYTVLAAGAIGAQTIAVEPIPDTFRRLERNVRVNDLVAKTELHQCGLAGEEGEIRFVADLDTMNRVALPDEIDHPSVLVRVHTLDGLCAGRTPKMAKIDVEGYESRVLAGATTTLSDKTLEVLLMETNSCGERFGGSDATLIDHLRGFGFVPCTYDAIRRELTPERLGRHNTIFVRDVAAVQERCRASRTYRLVQGSI